MCQPRASGAMNIPPGSRERQPCYNQGDRNHLFPQHGMKEHLRPPASADSPTLLPLTATINSSQYWKNVPGISEKTVKIAASVTTLTTENGI